MIDYAISAARLSKNLLLSSVFISITEKLRKTIINPESFCLFTTPNEIFS